MKKALAFLLMVSLLLSMLAFAAAEEEEPEKFTSGNWEYIVLEDGMASISKYKGEDAEVVVPEELDGKKVTEIGDRAFASCTTLKSITIPDSVTSIGKDAFKDCKSLTATVGRNSYAKQYCEENGIKYTYADANDWLND